MKKPISKCIRLSTADVLKLEEIKLAGRKKGLYISNQSIIQEAVNNYLNTYSIEDIVETAEAKIKAEI